MMSLWETFNYWNNELWTFEIFGIPMFVIGITLIITLILVCLFICSIIDLPTEESETDKMIKEIHDKVCDE